MKNVIIERTKTTESYLNEIKKYPLMTIEEEVEAFTELNDPSTSNERKAEIKNRILKANQRYAFSKAKEYQKDNNVMDLVSEANIGMMKAIEKFDVTRGYKFITFAVHYIEQAFTLYYYNNAFVKKSNALKIGNSVNKIVEKFYQENQRDPSIEEIKEILKEKKGIEVKDNRDICNVSCNSVDSYIGDDDDMTYEKSAIFNAHTAVVNEAEVESEKEANRTHIAELLRKLDDRSSDIIQMLFGVGKYDVVYDIEDVANKYNLTEARVGQLKKAALTRMAV